MAAMATMPPPEQNAAGWLVYHSLKTQFPDTEVSVPWDDFYIGEDKTSVAPNQEEDKPVHTMTVDLPLPGGPRVLILEEFADKSWATFFKDCPDIIGGSNKSWGDAISDLAITAHDILQDILQYQDAVSPYQEKRRQFIKKAFNIQ